MKLQLDNEALERLIGGHTELEVELRNGIISTFAKKHLKGVLTQVQVEKFMLEVRKETQIDYKAVLEKYFDGATGGLWAKPKINHSLQTLIKDTIEQEVSTIIHKKIDLELKHVMGNIESMVRHKVNDVVMREVKAEVKQKMLEGLK